VSLFFHAGVYAGHEVEIEVESPGGEPRVTVLIGGKYIGRLTKDSLRQVFQYIVNNNGFDLDEMREGKKAADE
jgi:hypothetical protein